MAENNFFSSHNFLWHSSVGHLTKKTGYLVGFNTSLPKAGKTTKVQVTIQKMPTVITNPILAIPWWGEKAKPPKLELVVKAP